MNNVELIELFEDRVQQKIDEAVKDKKQFDMEKAILFNDMKVIEQTLKAMSSKYEVNIEVLGFSWNTYSIYVSGNMVLKLYMNEDGLEVINCVTDKITKIKAEDKNSDDLIVGVLNTVADYVAEIEMRKE